MVLMLMLELKSYNYIETPFSIVCRKGNESIVKYLIKNGADVSIESQDYGNIKSVSCEKGNEAIIQYLINNGVNFNVELKKIWLYYSTLLIAIMA